MKLKKLSDFLNEAKNDGDKKWTKGHEHPDADKLMRVEVGRMNFYIMYMDMEQNTDEFHIFRDNLRQMAEPVEAKRVIEELKRTLDSYIMQVNMTHDKDTQLAIQNIKLKIKYLELDKEERAGRTGKYLVKKINQNEEKLPKHLKEAKLPADFAVFH